MPHQDLEVSLGSGGLKGMYQVGLFSALEDRHMARIGRCAGVSAGALTAACLASPAPRATLQAYYRTAVSQPLVPSGNKYWRAAKRYFGHKDSLYDGAIFEKLVRDTLAPIAHNKVLDVGVKPLASRNQHSVQLTADSPFEDVVQSVLASAAIMGVFPPRNLPSLGPCVDGGFISGLHLPRLRQAVQDRDSRVLMVVSCVPSCATDARAEADYLGESLVASDAFDAEAPTLHTAVMHWVDHTQKLACLGDAARLRHELGLSDMPDGNFGALYDGSGNPPTLYNADTPLHALPVAPAATAKPMAMVLCAPKLADGFSLMTSDIALMTGTEQHKRRAVLERYYKVGVAAAPEVSQLLDVAAKWTASRRNIS